MEAKLVGVHKVTRELKSGEVTYYYAWRGGPRIKAKPGTRAFTREFIRLTRDRPPPAEDQTIGWLVQEYLASAEYQKLKPSTRRDYERIIGAIRVKFGLMPIRAVEAKGARKVFLAWRDTMRDTPRSADMHVTVLARLLSWAKDREDVMRNPLEGVEKLHDGGNRKDAIWMPNQLRKILDKGAPHIVNVVKMALWTMQRQADILTMPTLAYDDGRLWITQAKTGARVRVAPADEILPILADAKEKKRQRVLVNSFGQNWTSSGFRASFRTEMKRLDISGVRFHDLRGTGITYAYAHGMDIERIAEISGHSKAECEAIIRKNYLAGGDVIEAIRAGTKGA
jgi:integrase